MTKQQHKTPETEQEWRNVCEREYNNPRFKQLLEDLKDKTEEE